MFERMPRRLDGGEPLERCVGVGKWLPRRQAVGEKVRAFRRERPAEDRGNAHGGIAKDVAIRTVALRLHAMLGLRVRAQHGLARERHAVRAAVVRKAFAMPDSQSISVP